MKCRATYTFSVTDTGTYPIAPVTKALDVCVQDKVEPLEVISINNAPIQWYTAEGSKLSSTPTYQTEKPGTYRWLVTQEIAPCESVAGLVSVDVHDPPEIKTVNIPERICKGDEIILSATGGVQYTWTPQNAVKQNGSTFYSNVMLPTTFYVKGYDEFGCANIDSVTYSDIEQCCTISYPDAFTPNNDGKNDGWKPVSYGNFETYFLSVYNRWGQRVFSTADPNEHWKGTFGGKDLGMDTYHYYLRATCLTGHIEISKGAFILIR